MYCQTCGKEIRNDASVCIFCGVSTYRAMGATGRLVYCKTCGKEIRDDASVCIHCGVSANQAYRTDFAPKPRIAYILLGIFLGTLGIHNFYAGYTNRAVAQLLISVLSFGLLAFGVFIWNIVEVCTVTTDVNGVYMT